jgi:ketosteroid isomerase-like protein
MVDGTQAAVVSHLSAVSTTGRTIEAEVMNYFRIEGGRITYMANFHDTAPFRVLDEG